VVVGLHAGVDTPAPTLLRPVLLACWWTALALGAIQSLASGHLDLLSATSGAGLLMLTPAFLGTLRDLRDLPTAD
jgi:hypothetical protein